MDDFRVAPTPPGGVRPSHQAVDRAARDGKREKRREEFRRALRGKGGGGKTREGEPDAESPASDTEGAAAVVEGRSPAALVEKGCRVDLLA